MSDNDDYLSAKFLVNSTETATTPKTYSQLRREASKKSQEKSASNQRKSKRQRELISREEGLSKSLFEKVQEEEQAGVRPGNKALAMMMKMGFTPGQSLGRQSKIPENEGPPRKSSSPPQHKTEPLPIDEWMGKKGIGTIKRTRSPSAHDRIRKMAKMEEESTQRLFCDRTRQEYEERKAEADLGPAQLTCSTLDEKAGKTLNVLQLDPNKPETFPSGLMEVLIQHYGHDGHVNAAGAIQDRLRKQMQADALSTSERDQEDEDGDVSTRSEKQKNKHVEVNQEYDPDFLEEAIHFLRLQPRDRLHLVLLYLRTAYAYCFYCGMEYESQEDITTQCPGPHEDDHD